MLHLETILPETLDLLKRLQALQSTSELRLVGGTALALQLGHRTSADLDLFGKFDDTRILSEGISHCGKATLENSNASMLFYMIDGVKVDCVNYPYGWIDEPIVEDGITLASIRDISAMKLAAITNRGTKKDFVDFHELLKVFTFEEMIAFYLRKYPDASIGNVLRSLTYFEDAESDPMPKMFVRFDWEEAKNKILDTVRQFSSISNK